MKTYIFNKPKFWTVLSIHYISTNIANRGEFCMKSSHVLHRIKLLSKEFKIYLN